jgi:hypothetical protein
MRSLPQLEHEILQLPIELQISLLQTLATSLAKSFPPALNSHSSPQTDLKTVLLSMPNVVEDADFARVIDYGRELELSA